MKRIRNLEYQDEVQRDSATQFIAESYVSTGYYLHFHRNLEVYCVVKGMVHITIAGERKILTDGQIAIIDGLESHSYEINGSAEITYAHIGSAYLRNFISLYPNSRLPRWLMEVEKNKHIYQKIQQIVDENGPSMLEIRKIGVACDLIADVIDSYGTWDKLESAEEDTDLITQVIQYIYEHYNEKITLESLSKKFYISPKMLSRKLSARLNVDLRVFINDIRVQKAVLMLDAPSGERKKLNDILDACGFNNLRTFYRSYERNFKFHKIKDKS